ncbi:MAG: SDR family oxidoreductase [Planctomycetota bacterium]|jgi:3-oxoacyl-[acyl-carrier protein] reductase|nr:SDR family oxidoreductase [Planctomycetota bacterium]
MREKLVSLITGASKGIGKAIAKRFLKRGLHVIGSYARDDEAADETRKEFFAFGEKFLLVRADFSAFAGIDIVETAVAAAGGRLHFLVSNVGITDRVDFQDTTPDNWERVIRTNLTIPFFLVQRAAKWIPDETGRIVFIGATMGLQPHSISYSYAASKAALHFLAKCLVKEFSPKGITVNVVAPGFVDTPMQSEKDPEHRKRIEHRIAVGRFARPDEVAAVVEGLLDHRYVTGQVIAVDGGYDCR